VAGVAVALALLMASGPAVAQEDDQRFDNEYCLSCHADEALSTTLPGGEPLDLTVEPEVYDDSVHGELGLSCVLCHTDIQGFPHDPITADTSREYTIENNQVCADCHLEQFTAAQDNVHGEALEAGNLEAAVCSDCHGAHDTRAPEPHSPEIVETCRTCHVEIYDLYEQSVHGEALETGNRDVPTCTDCHGVHQLEGPSADSDHPFRLFSPQICAECHADDELMSRYGISTDVFESYISDFHGETVVLFEELAPGQATNKAVCIDCHGVHAIKSADDPDSTVNKGHLLQTCQRCHPDATENFPDSWLSHYIPEPGQATVVFGVQLFYRIFIPLVLGGMAIYVVAHQIRRTIDRRRAREHG
jgi:hypothetical protein